VVAVAVTARDDILARVRAATATATVPDVSRDYRTVGEPVDLVELLVDRLVDYRAAVTRVAPGGVREAIASAAAGTLVIPPGLDPDWTDGLDTIADHALTPAELDATAGVVTAAALAIAETGTIVLDAAADQGRRAITLVPDLHVCVLRANQIVRTVPEAFARLDPDRPLTLISGPSATSDIELNRVEGVHGPRTLHVIIIDSAVIDDTPTE
jgi:L-lactate dehydrogenase complex protein LldG